MSTSNRPVKTSVITNELHPYEYLTDTTPHRYYNHWFFRGLDAVGRLLSFERNKPASSFNAKDWMGFTLVWGTGGVLGIAGALLRVIASFGQDDFKIKTYEKEKEKEKEKEGNHSPQLASSLASAVFWSL